MYVMPAGLKRWLIFALLCVIAAPAAIFLLGSALIGPYEGASGMIGLMQHIYSDALAGEPAAWLVLLAPCLLILIWSISFRISRLLQA